MPALDSDIGAASRDVVTAQWSDSAIAARYPSARDGLISPAEGYFDAIADAQTVLNARATLIGTEGRRFAVAAADIVWPSISTATPSFGLIDAEQAVNGTLIATQIELDLDAETTSIGLYGTAGMA